MPAKGHKNQACDCLLNLWSGSNKTYNSPSRARRRPERMGPVLHQHSFIQDVRGFGVLEIWVPERGHAALIHPVYLSFHSTAICHSKGNNCCGWKMHSVYNKAVPWSFNTLPIQTLLYAGELNNVLKSVTSFTAAIWSWYYTQFPGSKSPMETNRMLTALTGQRRFQFILSELSLSFWVRVYRFRASAES